jgi:peptidoglycan biosynthesis protein MviN/MurJ (putative lipid II flippase)
MRTLTALQANRVLLPVSAATMAVNVVLNYVLSIPYGVAGIALAMSASQAGLCLVLGWLVLGEPGRRRLCPENAT